MRQLLRLAILLSGLLLVACNNGGNSQSCADLINANQCSIAAQNQCVHELMQRHYLWYQQVPAEINYEDFISPTETLDFLRYEDPGPDRFSSITTEDAFDSLFAEGQYLGFGFSYLVEESGHLRVRFVYTDSPAGEAGMQRGDQIVSINDQTSESLTENPGWPVIFGGDEIGYPVRMRLQREGQGEYDVAMQKSVVNINTVLHSSVIDQAGIPVGYLVFKSFLQTSIEELDAVFADFRAAGVSHVILDLRYNGGGSVNVSNHLASYLRPGQSSGQLFNRLEFNDLNTAENTHLWFDSEIQGLQLDRLVVITSSETASASEMVINGLAPYVEVRTLGATTYGKPVGMSPFFFCDNALLPVTFQIENSAGVGEYFDGLAADCARVDDQGALLDDYSFAFGDAQSPLLRQALDYVVDGQCVTQRGRRSAHSIRLPVFNNPLEALIGAD
jgi:C-terminal processing protease CtpA/Prc